MLAAPTSHGWSRGVPRATHQLAHPLPRGSCMSPCRDLRGV